MADEFEKIENNTKKRNISASKIAVRIMAAFLAFLMVLSVATTTISLLAAK